MLEDIKQQLPGLRQRTEEMRQYLSIPRRRQELEHLEAEASNPEFWSNQNKARENIEKVNALKSFLVPFIKLERDIDDLEVMVELAEDEADPAQKDSTTREAKEHLNQIESSFRKLELQTLLNGPLDTHNAYLSLHAGAGGTESCDWAEMLFRMYRRYIESHGFSYTVMDYLAGDEAGIKSVSFQVTGPYAYGHFKAERGVHRLVRISPFDANKRRHTSFVSLDVVAEVDESIEIEINEKDLRIDTYRSSGAGGQHVNKTDSAVRITHIPTNIVVACQAERSQHSNRNSAMKMLRARLYELELDNKKKEMERFYSPKGEIAWGHQIRSYVLQPYTLVKDHRTDIETSNVAAVLDGDLDIFIEGYLKQHRTHEPTG